MFFVSEERDLLSWKAISPDGQPLRFARSMLRSVPRPAFEHGRACTDDGLSFVMQRDA